MILGNFLVFIFLKCYIISTVKCEDPSTSAFKEFLQTQSVDPKTSFESGLAWVQKQTEKLGLEFSKHDNFGFVSTWRGLNSSLPSLFINIPIQSNSEELKPTPRDSGFMGPGIHRMSNLIEILESIRIIKTDGQFHPDRTTHLGFFQRGGLELFVSTQEFEAMNIGFALDEGLPNTGNNLDVYYTQRINYRVNFTAFGPVGDGSLLLSNTAGEKLEKVLEILLRFRRAEKWRLLADKSLRLGDVTTINLNMLSGGVHEDLIPSSLSAVFDIRVTPHWDIDQFANFLNDTTEQAGSDVTFDLLTPVNLTSSSKFESGTWWWENFYQVFTTMNISIAPRIYPGNSDAQYLRKVGVPVFGISVNFNKQNNTEALSEEEFLQGIQIYIQLLQKLTTIPKSAVTTTSKPTSEEFTFSPTSSFSTKPTKKPGKSSANTANKKFSFILILITLILTQIFSIH